MPAESVLRPIGIFDSGIGGLTVAAAIRKQLPLENFIYFGDTANLPYGNKSARTIRSYSASISKFLIGKGCKAIVIACNTASATSFDHLRQAFTEIPIIGVIDPTIDLLLSNENFRRIGIIGTKATIKAGVYQKKIQAMSASREIVALATPLLVPMIEEGFFNNRISQTVIDTYLKDPIFSAIDCLVLACTHYPLIKGEIAALLGEQVSVIDSAQSVALATKKVLHEQLLLSTHLAGADKFYVSDLTSSFAKSARLFFGNDVVLEQTSESV